jgi:hypothetical protein
MRRRFAALALCALAPALTGCATVWTRGVVVDAGGAPVPGVPLDLRDGGSGKLVSRTSTDANGCFLLGPFAAGAARSFELEAGSPGYKRATFAFALETPILLVLLEPPDSEASSAIRPATYAERAGKFDPFCVPSWPPGAQELGP